MYDALFLVSVTVDAKMISNPRIINIITTVCVIEAHPIRRVLQVPFGLLGGCNIRHLQYIHFI